MDLRKTKGWSRLIVSKRGVFPGRMRRKESKEVCVPDRWRQEPSLQGAGPGPSAFWSEDFQGER